MRIQTLLATVILAAAIPAYAAEQVQHMPVAATVTDPKQMPAGLYTLDPAHAHALFHISHMGFSEYVGGFNDISGQLVFKPDALGDSKLNVTIKTSSIDVQSPKLVENLKGPAFFDAVKFPEITFTNTSLVPVSATQGKLTGNLTMHGVTRPVTLDVTFKGAGIMPMTQNKVIGFVATGKLNRSDFGMDTYTPGLGDEVDLDISAEFDLVETKPPTQK